MSIQELLLYRMFISENPFPENLNIKRLENLVKLLRGLKKEQEIVLELIVNYDKRMAILKACNALFESDGIEHL